MGMAEEIETDPSMGWADAITSLGPDQPAASFCATGGKSGKATKPASETEGEERGTQFMLSELHKVGEVLVEVGSTSSSSHAFGPSAIETEEELEETIARLDTDGNREINMERRA